MHVCMYVFVLRGGETDRNPILVQTRRTRFEPTFGPELVGISAPNLLGPHYHPRADGKRDAMLKRSASHADAGCLDAQGLLDARLEEWHALCCNVRNDAGGADVGGVDLGAHPCPRFGLSRHVIDRGLGSATDGISTRAYRRGQLGEHITVSGFQNAARLARRPSVFVGFDGA